MNSNVLLVLMSEAEVRVETSFLDTYRPYILLVGILIVVTIMLRATARRAKASRNRAHKSVEERVQDMTGQNQMYGSLNQLMAELAELSRQINGQIDTRCKRLEILLHQADEKIKQFECLGGGISVSNNPLPEKAALPKLSKGAIAPETVNKNAESQVKSPHSAGTSGSGSKEKNDKAVEEVLELAGQGMNPVSIAQILGRPVGEVELILSLKGAKKPPPEIK